MKKNYQKPVMKTGKINDQLLAGSGNVSGVDGGDSGISYGGGGTGGAR